MVRENDEIKFEGRKVVRRYDKEWYESGTIRKEAIPDLVRALVEQQKGMVEYIGLLERQIEWILEVNGCCDIPGCFRAGCTSSHK